MSTIGEQMSGESEEQRKARLRREAKWGRRKDTAIGVALVVGGIALFFGAVFLLVYLVTLAVRLGWGS